MLVSVPKNYRCSSCQTEFYTYYQKCKICGAEDVVIDLKEVREEEKKKVAGQKALEMTLKLTGEDSETFKNRALNDDNAFNAYIELRNLLYGKTN